MSRHNIMILLICLAAIGLRCWKINAPFTDPWSWRQSDVAAIARNYSETGFRFARPRIDWAGDQPGFVGTEFPILPFMAAIVYKLLGVHEWIGRAETIVLFLFSLPFFLGMVRNAVGEIATIAALLFYCFAPLSIAASRVFMPDMPSLALALAGLYFFRRALAPSGQASLSDLLLAAAMTALALLIKIPMATIAAPMASLAWRKFGWGIFHQWGLWLYAVIVLLPSLIWYWHAHEIAERFYPYHFFGGGGVRIMNWSWYGRIAAETFSSTLTPVLFVLAVAGIFVSMRNEEVAPFRWWLAAMILFVAIIGYGNRHQWYQLPLVPIAAMFGGAGTSMIGKRWGRATAAVILILFLAFSLLSTRRFFSSPAEPLWELGRALRGQTPDNALIIAADDGDPTALYYAHRKGWHFLQRHGLYYGNPTDTAQVLANLEELRKRGATHLVFYSGTSWWLNCYGGLAEELTRRTVLQDATPKYRIYKLVQ